MNAAAGTPPRRVGPPAFAVETRTGARWTVGAGTPEFVIRIADGASWRRLVEADLLAAAKAFIDRRFDVDGDIISAVRWRLTRQASNDSSLLLKVVHRLRLESWVQTRRHARRNIEFHYDRSNEFYRQFLDRQMVYSSAYFADPSMSLDAAQSAKLDYVVRKLDLTSGDRFLDVGCGWGALVIHAAQRGVSSAMGCTLSAQQFEYASQAIRSSGVSDRATIYRRDYRTMQGVFDKIASIGMYEHVGRHRLGEYFRTLATLLTSGGLLLNSGIARPETVRDDAETLFLQQFVFPGGEIPYLAEVIRAAEHAGLEVLDVENLRRHYALTCARWVSRLQRHRDACLSVVDAATYRTWLLYLAGSVISFERGESELYQILFAKRGASRDVPSAQATRPAAAPPDIREYASH